MAILIKCDTKKDKYQKQKNHTGTYLEKVLSM